MSDIFQEVSDDVRREKAQQLWKRYNVHIIAAAFAVIAAVSGWTAYNYYAERQAEAASARFEQAVAVAQGGRTAEAAATLNALTKDGTAGYQLLARFRLAAETASDKAEDGIKAFKAIAADNSVEPLLQELAKIRAGYLMIDNTAYSEVAAFIEPLTGADGPWRHSAREILGLVAWKEKDLDKASRWFQAVISDKDVPEDIRLRADMMLQLVASDQPLKKAS